MSRAWWPGGLTPPPRDGEGSGVPRPLKKFLPRSKALGNEVFRNALCQNCKTACETRFLGYFFKSPSEFFPGASLRFFLSSPSAPQGEGGPAFWECREYAKKSSCLSFCKVHNSSIWQVNQSILFEEANIEGSGFAFLFCFVILKASSKIFIVKWTFYCTFIFIYFGYIFRIVYQNWNPSSYAKDSLRKF